MQYSGFGGIKSRLQNSVSKPIFKEGQSFERKGVFWNLVTIVCGSETVQVAANLSAEDASSSNEVGTVETPLSGVAISRVQALQWVFCFPFGKKEGLKQPQSTEELKKLLFYTMQTLEKGEYNGEIIELDKPVNTLFAVQYCQEPRFEVARDSRTVIGSEVIKRKQTVKVSGSAVKAIATKIALYLLVEQRYEKELSDDTKFFFDSFKVT